VGRGFEKGLKFVTAQWSKINFIMTKIKTEKLVW